MMKIQQYVFCDAAEKNARMERGGSWFGRRGESMNPDLHLIDRGLGQDGNSSLEYHWTTNTHALLQRSDRITTKGAAAKYLQGCIGL